ncbi:hypothetical protein Bca101_046735 [Brassica carinata]
MILHPGELNFDLIRSAKVFHYGSISLIGEPCRSHHLKAMEEEAKKHILSSWKKAEVIKVNDEELMFLIGSDNLDDETALSQWHSNLNLLYVTLGEKGCNYYTKSFRGSVDPFHVNVVDTTSTGDSYVGALLCTIVGDRYVPEEEARLLELGLLMHVEPLQPTKKGAIPALPTMLEVETLLNAN